MAQMLLFFFFGGIKLTATVWLVAQNNENRAYAEIQPRLIGCNNPGVTDFSAIFECCLLEKLEQIPFPSPFRQYYDGNWDGEKTFCPWFHLSVPTYFFLVENMSWIYDACSCCVTNRMACCLLQDLRARFACLLGRARAYYVKTLGTPGHVFTGRDHGRRLAGRRACISFLPEVKETAVRLLGTSKQHSSPLFSSSQH